MPKNRRRNLAAVLAADARAKAERAFVAAAPAQRRRQPDVQLGVRVPRDLAERLRATVQLRHAAGLHPFTAAGVVAAALTAWLDQQQAEGATTPKALAQKLRAVADQLEGMKGRK
jgi:AcrR family transcriptional regulator